MSRRTHKRIGLAVEHAQNLLTHKHLVDNNDSPTKFLWVAAHQPFFDLLDSTARLPKCSKNLSEFDCSTWFWACCYWWAYCHWPLRASFCQDGVPTSFGLSRVVIKPSLCRIRRDKSNYTG